MSERFCCKKVIDAGVMTGTTVLLGEITDLALLDNVSYEVNWTGTPTGTLTFECSNSYERTANPSALFFALTFPTAPASPAGSANTGYGIDLNQVPFRYIRPRYVNASSTGVLNIWIFGKGL